MLEPQLADRRRRAFAYRSPRERAGRADAIDAIDVVKEGALEQPAIGERQWALHVVLPDGCRDAVIEPIDVFSAVRAPAHGLYVKQRDAR